MISNEYLPGWPEPIKGGIIIKEIKRLNKNEASKKSDISITVIHKNADIFANILAEFLKGAIKTYSSPNRLKLADITPLNKKKRKDNKEN